jgi:hypothetical protein
MIKIILVITTFQINVIQGRLLENPNNHRMRLQTSRYLVYLITETRCHALFMINCKLVGLQERTSMEKKML